MNYFPIFATAIVALFPGQSLAQTADPTILVMAKPVSVAQWSQKMTRGINTHLYYPDAFFGRQPDVGFVSVVFSCGDDGRPTGVTLTRKSGSRSLDRAAMYAVNNIKSLHPLPVAFRTGQRFVANIMFATDRYEYDRQLVILNKAARAQNDRVLAQDRPIALNVSFGAGAG